MCVCVLIYIYIYTYFTLGKHTQCILTEIFYLFFKIFTYMHILNMHISARQYNKGLIKNMMHGHIFCQWLINTQ